MNGRWFVVSWNSIWLIRTSRTTKEGRHCGINAYGCVLCLLLLVVSIQPNYILATSWARLEPEEVLQRASVIVQGNYIVEDGAQRYDKRWAGYHFKVDKVYRGSVPALITAAIIDVDVAQALQAEGGSYLLFLEKSKDSDMLVPVAGPNGMINIKNGIISNYDEAASAYYKDFLQQTKSKRPIPDESVRDSVVYWTIGILLFFALCASAYFFIRKTIHKHNPT